MIKKKCDRCGKIIEGYSDQQVEYMLKQHQDSKKCKKTDGGK